MEQKSLGIITFHTASNYGAVLQAYALKTICEEMGYRVFFIRYSGFDRQTWESPFIQFKKERNKKRGAINLSRAILSNKGDKKRFIAFREFRKQYFEESVLCHNSTEIAALGYDVYISGSDQIWNYNITGGRFDPVFFLDFESNAKRIIYAASSCDIPFSHQKEAELRIRLKRCEASVGIRESSLAKYVQNLMRIDYPVVLDPTLLAGADMMNQISVKSRMIEPYILIYQIDRNPYSDISIKTLEQRFKCKVISMSVPRIGNQQGRCGDAGPEEFLSLLKGAKFIVTNSFHGVALSIIFRKQFYVYEHIGVMSRINDLLELLQIDNRNVCMVNDIDLKSVIDYDNVWPRLQKEQNKSRDFLKKALDGRFFHKKIAEKEEQKPSIKKFKERRISDCCGCSACADICPTFAITMKQDEEGFLYPARDDAKCIQCGACDQVCGFNKPEERDSVQAYGLKLKDDKQRLTSRSGGAFVAFSDWILKKKGIIYGAKLTEDFSVKHVRVDNAKGRDSLKKAKYVQSSTLDVFPQVGKDLCDGKYVLFTGTPCQVAGLIHYLEMKKIDINRLFTCDLICHGVPSPMVWGDYIKYIRDKYRKEILIAEFRDKEYGWESHYESFCLKGKRRKVVSRDYTNLFYQHIMFRPSCENCQFANMNRVGDLTLGDFWGIEKHDGSFNDNQGVSLVFVNSDKGRVIMDDVKDQFEVLQCDPYQCLQPTLERPSKASPRRSNFWDDYKKLSFKDLLKKYTVPIPTDQKMKYHIKNSLYHLGIRRCP